MSPGGVWLENQRSYPPRDHLSYPDCPGLLGGLNQVICAKQTGSRHEMFAVIIIVAMTCLTRCSLPHWVFISLVKASLCALPHSSSQEIPKPPKCLSTIPFPLPRFHQGDRARCCLRPPHSHPGGRPNPRVSLLCADHSMAPQCPQDKCELSPQAGTAPALVPVDFSPLRSPRAPSPYSPCNS